MGVNDRKSSLCKSSFVNTVLKVEHAILYISYFRIVQRIEIVGLF